MNPSTLLSNIRMERVPSTVIHACHPDPLHLSLYRPSQFSSLFWRMIPKLSLGGSPEPGMPGLNLGGGGGLPSLGLGEQAAPAAAGKSPPGLSLGGLGLGALNLTNLPPAAAKSEKHKVIICAPYAEVNTDAEFHVVEESLEETFGEGTTIIELPTEPARWIIEADPAAIESAIPSLEAIDAAYQDTEHLPYLIDQANREGSDLNQQIEQEITEIESLKKEREDLRISIAVLNEKLENAKAESLRFSEAAIRVKKDFDVFVEKFGGSVPQ
jgi:hypothetical protein